jgi:thiosulfate dehydrogenase
MEIYMLYRAFRSHTAPLLPAVILGIGLLLASEARPGRAEDQTATPAKPATKEVLLCDNKTKVAIAADTPRTPQNGQRVAQALMAQWKNKNPAVAKDWMAEENEKHEVVPPADNSKLIGSGQGSTYGQVTAQAVEVWSHETYKLAVRGSTIFHSADKLGSEIAVSCDMCHLNAVNTHPETYPKFQESLGKVAMLRDMINWCIQHPVRGRKLADDDPKMKALEAYILAQRKGVALDYGKQ